MSPEYHVWTDLEPGILYGMYGIFDKKSHELFCEEFLTAGKLPVIFETKDDACRYMIDILHGPVNEEGYGRMDIAEMTVRPLHEAKEPIQAAYYTTFYE